MKAYHNFLWVIHRLTPEEANQADMTLEWYFEDSSSLSGGVFVKDLKSFIDYVESPVEIEGVRYFASYPGKSEYGATIKGAEFAYQQSLENFLPEPFNGLGFQLNYTYVDSSYDEPELKSQACHLEVCRKTHITRWFTMSNMVSKRV